MRHASPTHSGGCWHSVEFFLTFLIFVSFLFSPLLSSLYFIFYYFEYRSWVFTTR